MSSGAASWMLHHCGGLLGTCLAWVVLGGLGAEWTACCVLSCCRALVAVIREASSSMDLGLHGCWVQGQRSNITSETKLWPRGYMVAKDLGPEARYKDVRCVKYERSASKVNGLLNKPFNFNIYKVSSWKVLAGAVETSDRCSRSVWQVW